MYLSKLGKTAKEEIYNIPLHHTDAEVLNSVIMPNHIHMVIRVGARDLAPLQLWQRLFHEHIIRNQQDFDKIMEYVDNNVIRWKTDCFN